MCVLSCRGWVHGPKKWGFEGWGGPTQIKWGPEGWGPKGWGPEVWGPEGWGQKGGGQKGGGAKISRFF